MIFSLMLLPFFSFTFSFSCFYSFLSSVKLMLSAVSIFLYTVSNVAYNLRTVLFYHLFPLLNSGSSYFIYFCIFPELLHFHLRFSGWFVKFFNLQYVWKACYLFNSVSIFLPSVLLWFLF